MTVLFIADDSLFPTNSGGRAEALGECKGMLERGVPFRLVVSHRLDISEEDKARHRDLDPNVIFIKRVSAVRSTFLWPHLPYQLSSRQLRTADAKRPADETDISLIIASHEWTIDLAAKIARHAKAPILLRSHNDEVAYMKSLAADAGIARRMYYLAEAIRLHLTLPRLLKTVQMVAILSPDDRAPYEALGLPTTLVPPVLSEDDASTVVSYRQPPNSADILFVGSLDAPHAVQGLRWFITEVLPKVKNSYPSAQLVVAGRRASTTLARELDGNSSIRFLGEVTDLEELLLTARVFVNPVFGGSGVNMKVGPPSQRGVPVVTTKIGARGLDALSEGLCIADDANEFGAICLRLLKNDDEWSKKSALLQENIALFSSSSSGEALQNLVASMGHDYYAQ